jgi:hypothetical protein
MAGLVPAIHVFLFPVQRKQGVDARNKCGHDDESVIARRPSGRRSNPVRQVRIPDRDCFASLAMTKIASA